MDIELVIGVYKWFYKSMVYGINYVYDRLCLWMAVLANGVELVICIYEWLCSWMVVLMNITWSNNLVVLEIE